ncbi:hypothetical protein NDU88_006463 [Pleurodeles waltl]|uniref:Secreted protein n=1 Tax=Pleurodeles waltl TaxID=8319 RepID=A0AAV7X0T8_PLEWA|nr:hypothetical protein NDU88_006463 [Pleurodeles waltl]
MGKAVFCVAGYIVAASSPPATGFIVAAGCYIENIEDTVVVVADGLHVPSEECALARSHFRLRATAVLRPRTPILEIFRCGFIKRLEFFSTIGAWHSVFIAVTHLCFGE